MKLEKLLTEQLDEMGRQHELGFKETALRPDAFKMSNTEKVLLIEEKIQEVLHVLRMDLTDNSLKGTLTREAKMFVNKIFSGLHPDNKPESSTIETKYKYPEMLVEKNITLFSTCEHHLLPIIGKAHVAYISNGTVVGLSKMNRIVDYFAKRPQAQERLTLQIVGELQKILKIDNVACVIDAKHLCVNSRGFSDISSSTITSEFGGRFKEKEIKKEFLDYIKLESEF